MDEQLVQELASQLDGQIAQACGSHDPNAKGSYIWNTYPQVQSCANYHDAVLLLAREQAALQTPQQPQNFGQVNQGFGQVSSGFATQSTSGLEQTGFGTAQAGFGQPQTGFGAAQTGFGQAQFGQPQTGFNQQQAQFGQPQASFNPQQAGFGVPPTPNVFGTPAVPVSGQPGATQYTAFQPQKPEKGSKNGKVFGFIPSNIFAIILLSLFVIIIIAGVINTIKKANKKAQPQDVQGTQVEQPIDNAEPTGTSVDALFN